MESLQETTITHSNGIINKPYDFPFPQNGVPNATQDQLRDACYHLANMIEDIDKISFVYDIMSRAMSPFAKLLVGKYRRIFKFFHRYILWKIVMKWLLNTKRHLNYVATLPCEKYISKNHYDHNKYLCKRQKLIL